MWFFTQNKFTPRNGGEDICFCTTKGLLKNRFFDNWNRDPHFAQYSCSCDSSGKYHLVWEGKCGSVWWVVGSFAYKPRLPRWNPLVDALGLDVGRTGCEEEEEEDEE